MPGLPQDVRELVVGFLLQQLRLQEYRQDEMEAVFRFFWEVMLLLHGDANQQG